MTRHTMTAWLMRSIVRYARREGWSGGGKRRGKMKRIKRGRGRKNLVKIYCEGAFKVLRVPKRVKVEIVNGNGITCVAG